MSTSAEPLETLARELLGYCPGQRLPTVVDYQERLGVGSGTIQSRIGALKAIGAIELAAHGHRGTYLVGRDVSELWHLARLGPLRGVMPLPEALEPVALAAGLRQEFERLGIPLELLYLRSAERRAQQVREGAAHFAVMSSVAAEWAIANDKTDWFVLGFGPQTYHRQGGMIVIERAVDSQTAVRRVGMDRASHDHALMTEAEFPAREGFEHVPYPHRRLLEGVVEGMLDAAVWHQTVLPVPLAAMGLTERPLSRPEAISIMEQTSHAVLIAPRAMTTTTNVLAECDLSVVRDLQNEIAHSGVLPIY
jgi:YhfZ C-terminal domain/Helix-turn-helix domain